MWNPIWSVLLGLGALGAGDDVSTKPHTAAYRQVVGKTAGMVGDQVAQQLTREKGLNVVNVTWEDTGRFKGSAVGPNISDMTIQVQTVEQDGSYDLTLMPVIRHPNFSDKTADVTLDQFNLLVGNEKGNDLRQVTLREFLGDIRSYLHDGRSWKGSKRSLLAKRDKHVLVSAQACFLPVPKQGIAEFNPVLFNYQSYEGDPAVLTILATREGTSVTVIDNKRDAFQAGRTWGQRLFFNQNGERAALTGKRLSDFVAAGGDATTQATSVQAAGEQGLNMVLLIQVALKQKNPRPQMVLAEGMMFGAASGDGGGGVRSRTSDVEQAVIGHGKVEGPFTEIDGLDIERAERFPIRVTVQFYKATSNGVVSAADVDDIAAQIDRVYADADYVGSLVTDGPTDRPTEYIGPKSEPPGWWDNFWKRYEANTGQRRDDALQLLWKLRMRAWPKDEDELKLRLEEARRR